MGRKPVRNRPKLRRARVSGNPSYGVVGRMVSLQERDNQGDLRIRKVMQQSIRLWLDAATLKWYIMKKTYNIASKLYNKPNQGG